MGDFNSSEIYLKIIRMQTWEIDDEIVSTE